MPAFTIKFPKSRTVKVIKDLASRDFQRAFASASKRAQAAMATEALRHATRVVTAKRKDFKDGVFPHRGGSDRVIDLGLSGKAINLGAFKHKRVGYARGGTGYRARHVTVQIGKTSGARVRRGAFAVTQESGHKGIYKGGLPGNPRSQKWKRGLAGPNALPIYELKGPSIGSLFAKRPTLVKAVQRRGSVVIQDRLNHEMGRKLQKHVTKAPKV